MCGEERCTGEEQRVTERGAEGRERGDMCGVGMAGEWVRMGARGYKIGRT